MYDHNKPAVQTMLNLLVLLAGVSGVFSTLPRIPNDRHFHIERHDEGGYALMTRGPFGKEYIGHIGRNSSVGTFGIHLNFDYVYNEQNGGSTVSISWEGPRNAVFVDCIDFGKKQWFAGPEQKEQNWPIQNSRLHMYSVISKEEDNSAISERYWLNSAGEYIYVSPDAPLFVDYNNIMDNHLCLIARVAPPYSSKRKRNSLKYKIWFFDDPKTAHYHAINTYLGKPSNIPDDRMVQHPIWSTWARYSRGITQDILWDFANEIKMFNFPNAQLEIDDQWETCYGSLSVDNSKFRNLKQFIQDVKKLDFRVTIWMHPFINKDCDPWYTEALENGWLVLDENGSPDTTWWNNNGSVPGYIDFTKLDAASWYADRVRNFLDSYDIDSVKFDAGESSWSPQIPVQEAQDIDLHPGHIVQAYVRKAAEFGRMVEVRAGMRTQDLPIFVRMVDKDTYWGYNNGLATVITTLLSMNLNGYPFVLPDMIGGNGYNTKPTKELFIRWLQVNVFMPTLQFSFVPWDYDEETTEICRTFTSLHSEYSVQILAAMEASVTLGTPVNPPIWWIDPTDQNAMVVSDEFLLGQTLLSAPVIEEGASSRDIYLPAGIWKDGNDGNTYEGPVWLKDYPAPLEKLPYFLLQD